MVNSINQPVQNKVYGYVLRRNQTKWSLLVFNHLDFPDAGTQVPGGTVEPAEPTLDAVLREVQEETGLRKFDFVEKLGVSRHDLSQYALPGIHKRHYFLMTTTESTPDTWIGYEMDPSDGSPAPIALKFYWVDLDNVPVLSAEMDEMLPVLKSRLKEKEAG